MTIFLYSLGSILFDVFTIWLAMLGVLFVFDLLVSKCRRKRNRRRLARLSETAGAATMVTVFALLAGSVDHYIMTPALGAGINFFFGS